MILFSFYKVNYFNYFKTFNGNNNIIPFYFFLGEDIIRVIYELININGISLFSIEKIKVIKKYKYMPKGVYYKPVFYKGMLFRILPLGDLSTKVFMKIIIFFLYFIGEYNNFYSRIFYFSNLNFLCKDILNFIKTKLILNYKLNYWLSYNNGYDNFMFCVKGVLKGFSYLNIYDVFIYKLIFCIPELNYSVNFIIFLSNIEFNFFFKFFIFVYFLSVFFKVINFSNTFYLCVIIFFKGSFFFIEYIWYICSVFFFINFYLIRIKFLSKILKKYLYPEGEVFHFFYGKDSKIFFFLGILWKNFLSLNLYKFFISIKAIKKKIRGLGFGFFNSKGLFKSKACLRYFNKNHKVTIFFLSSIFKSILLYYRFILNLRELVWSVRFILWISMGLLIKRKFKLLRLQQIIYTFSVGINVGLDIYPLFYIKVKALN